MLENHVYPNYHLKSSKESPVMAERTIFTLVFVKRNCELLLGLKARGFGVGLWNGFGGKLEDKESVMESAQRELKEESNLEAPEMRHLGIVTYVKENSPHKEVVHIFTANRFSGVIKASEEMNPIRWYKYEDIPYYKMWPDAKYWYPMMLEERCFSALIIYGANGKIKDKVLEEHSQIQDILKIENLETFR